MATFDSTTPDVSTLLAIERRISIHCWTVINELRLRSQLPQWVLNSFPDSGTRREWQAIHTARAAVDAALAGERVDARYVLGYTLEGEQYVLHDRDSEQDTFGAASTIAASEATEALTPSQLRMLARGVVAQARQLESRTR